MATSASNADVRLPARLPDDELPRTPASDVASTPEEPEPTTFAFGSDPRERHDNLNNDKRSLPNVRLPVWDGKRRQEPGAYKEWKREIQAIQFAYDIQDHRYAPLLFLATKDDARDVLWDLDADNPNSLDMIMTLLNKEFEKLDFEKSELAYQEFERCKRTLGQQMTAYLRDMDRTYTKKIKEDEGTKLSEVMLARRLLRRSGLNHDEQRHILAGCNHEYNLVKIKTAPHLTYGDASLDDSKRRFSLAPGNNNLPARKPVGGGHGGHHKKNTGFKKFKMYGANYLDSLPETALPDAADDDPEEDDQPADEQPHDPTEGKDQEGEDQPEDDEEDDADLDDADDEQLWEIFYQGMKAGKKLKSASKGWKKPGRPGRPSSSTASSSNVIGNKKTEKTGTCLDCGRFGHWN